MFNIGFFFVFLSFTQAPNAEIDKPSIYFNAELNISLFQKKSVAGTRPEICAGFGQGAKQLRKISRLKQAATKERVKLWLAILLPILGLVYVHISAHIMMYRIKFGMSEAEVLQIYGKPDKTDKEMLFCDGIFAWQGDCPNQRHQHYQFYKKGIDRWVIFGYDVEHRVAFKTLGDL